MLKVAVVLLVAFVFGLGAGASPSAAAGTYDNALIADVALQYVGRWGGDVCRDAERSGMTGSTSVFPVEPVRGPTGEVIRPGDGQCRAFVNCVVWMASGRTQWLGGGYFAGLARSGARIIDENTLVKGDIVQIGNSDSDPRLHTYIIVGPVAGNRYTVIDSNHDYKETVLAPYARTITLTDNVRAYRLGQAAAAPIEETAQAAGGWRASYSYTKTSGDGQPIRFVDQRLVVTHNGKTTLRTSMGASFWPGGFGSKPSIQFVDLDRDGQPELIWTLFSGGAHCCFSYHVYSFAASGNHRLAKLETGNVTIAIQMLEGRPALVTADDDFAYRYTSFGFSYFPIQILRFQHKRFVYITRSYPRLIKRDAARAWARLQDQLRPRPFAEPRGAAAGWAADQAMLGNAEAARSTLLALAAQGKLDVDRASLRTGVSFVADLWKVLRELHYIR